MRKLITKMNRRLVIGLLVGVALIGSGKAFAADAVGDYKCIATGNWSSASTWNYYNGSSWVTNGVPTGTSGSPYTGTITITGGFTVTVDASTTFYLGNGGKISNTGGTLTGSTAGKLYFQNGSNYEVNFSSGSYTILPTGTSMNWSPNSNITITNSPTMSGTYPIFTESGATYGNVTINSNATMYLLPGSTFTVTMSNFTYNSTGTNKIKYVQGGYAYIININGNFQHNSTTAPIQWVSTSSGTTITLNVYGDFKWKSGGTWTVGSFTGSSINLYGNANTFDAPGVNLNGFTVDFKQNSNYTLGSNLTSSNSSTYSVTIENGATLDCAGNTIIGQSSAGTFTLSSGGTLKTNSATGLTTTLLAGWNSGRTLLNTGANYVFYGSGASAVTGALMPTSANDVTINNVSGVSLSNNLIVNGTMHMLSGALNLNGKTFGYGASGTLSYEGTSGSQTTTSNEFPTPSGPASLKINNSSGVILHATRTLTGTLTLTSGNLTLNGNNITLASGIGVAGTPASTNHIIASSSGTVQCTYSSGAYTFPVGYDATHYNPVTITNNTGGTSQTYTVGSASISPSLSDAINYMWSIGGITSSNGTGTALQFSWLTNDANGTLSSSPSLGTIYNSNGAWSIQSGTTTTGTPNTTTITGVTGSNPLNWSVAVPSCISPAITSVTAPSSSICASATQTLTANGVLGTNAVVTWWTGTGGTGTNLGTGTTLSNQGPGIYFARVTADCGSAVEATITISTLSAVSIGTQPSSGTYTQYDSPTALSVTATGAGTLTYQWYTCNVDGTSPSAISSSTNSTYTPSTAIIGTTYYKCTITGTCNNITSNVVSVVVNAPVVPLLVYTSGTTAQTVSAGTAIGSIVYTWAGSATSASASWSGSSALIPTGVSATSDGGSKTLTIAGTPTVAGTYNYSVTSTDGSNTSSALTGSITVKLATPDVSLGAVSPTNQGFTAQWAAVTGVTSYTVKVYLSGVEVSAAQQTGVTGTSTSISGLSTNTTYTYTVTAIGDGSLVPNSNESAASASVKTLNTAKTITAFSISGQNTSTISGTNISVVVPHGTVVTSLTPTVTHTGASITPTIATDFTNPVSYTVTAEDGSQQVYTVTVTFGTAATDYFQSKADGNLSNVSTWQSSSDNSTWIDATLSPNNAASISVLHNVAVDASISSKKITIASGKTLTVNASQTLTINHDYTASSDLIVSGYLLNKGTITLAANATMTVSGTYEHNVDGGTVPTATWNDGSLCLISGIVNSTTLLGCSQNFHDFTWNCPSQTTTGKLNLGMFNNTIGGDLSFLAAGSSGTASETALTSSSAGTGAGTITITGNLIINAGASNKFGLHRSGGTGVQTSCNLIIARDLRITQGTVDLQINSGIPSQWNVKGNFTFSGGTLMSTKTGGYLNFNGISGTQSYSKTGGTFSGSNATIVVSNALDLGSSLIDGAFNFTINTGGTIKTSNTAGLANAISTTGAITYTAGANYEFAGATTTPLPNFTLTTSNSATSGQKVIPFTNTAGVVVGMAVTGTNIAANSTVASFIANTSVTLNNNIATGGVASGASITFGPTFNAPANVTISANVTLNAALTTGGLTLNSGTLADGGYTITNNGNITGTGTHTGSAKISMTGSGVKTISGATLKNLELNHSDGFNLSGSPTINGTLTLTSGNLTVGTNTLTLNGPAIAGTPANLVAGATSSIVIGGSTSGVVIPSSVSSLNNFTLNNTNGTTLQNDLAIAGTATLSNGTLTVGAHTLALNGAAIAGTATNLSAGGTSSISIGGSSSGVNIPSSVTALNNLTLNNSNGTTLQGILNVGGTLSLTAGTLTTGANALTLKGAISGSGTINTGSSGTLAFGGSSVQTLANTNLTGSAVNNLVINSGSQLTLTGSTITATNFTINSSGSGTGTILDGGLLAVTGATNVNQYLTAGRNWYFSSPVAAATGSVVLGTADAPTGNSLWQYNEGNSNWSDAMSATTPLTVTRGFIANNTSSGPITFSGTLNSGDITTPTLYRTGATKAGFNLIGNPYPSYVNLATFSSTNDTVHLETTYWLRSKTADKTAYVFDTYNLKAPETSISLSGKPVAGIIAPLQAFWVRVKSGFSSGSLTFHDSKRSHIDNAANVFRAPAAKTQTQSLLRLQVSNGLNYDEAVLYSNTDASNGYDDYDSQKYSNGSASIPEIYTLIGSEQLAINGMNNIPYDTEIPLGFSTGTAGDFSLKASQIVNFDPSVNIYLIDKNNGTNTPLTQDAVYTFSSGITTNNTSRFALLFRSSALSTGLNPTDTGSFWISTNANGQIQINGIPGGTSTVAVYNAVGQKLICKNLTSTIHALETELVPGVYFVTVSTNGRSITRKVLIN